MSASTRNGRLYPGHRPFLASFARVARLAILGGASVAFASDWLDDGHDLLPHPTIIAAEYHGKLYPVTAVSGETAEIEADGKLKRLRSNESYQPMRAQAYVPGYISFKSQSASSNITTQSYRFHGIGDYDNAIVNGGTIAANGDYKCSIMAAEAHAQCYLAVVFYRQDEHGEPDSKSIAVAFRQIGDLVAERETKVMINRGYLAAGGVHYYYFPLIFSKGREIRTNLSERASRFFRHQEMTTHAELLARYRQQYPAADQPALAYLRIPPQLPAGVDPRSFGGSLEATFAVSVTGTVDSIEIDRKLDPQVAEAIRTALSGWLFLPRLKQGIPMRTMVTVPLAFEP